MATQDYILVGDGFYRKVADGTGPYVCTAAGVFALVTTGSGGGAGGGDASAANQVAGNASLTSIDGKTPALGQQLAAASQPIVLTAAQLTTLTPPAAITGFALASKQPALGASATAGSTPVNIASDQVVPVSATALPLPTGAATAAKQPALGAAATAASTPVNIASDQTVPVSAASLPLPTGAATAAKQPALGAAVTSASTPVNIASDQTVPVSAATLPLPAGAATAAKQPALGTALTAASIPMTVATDDVISGALTETAPATDTASSGHNGRLQRIAQRLTSLIALLPGLGTKAMTGSQAVTLATDDTQIGAKTTASVLSAGGSGILGWLSDAVTQLKSLVSAASNTALPTESSAFNYTMNAPQKTFRCGFEAAIASGLDPLFFTAVAVGSGMAASQSGGSALITSGTTAYSESIYRSVLSFAASMSVRYSMNLSQRIANQEFYIEMVDVIGDALAFTVNSATSITVTIPGTTLTSANVGQSMYIGALSLASCPGGRYTIASVSGTAITFTVAAFPGSGSGTCSVFGWNFHHVLYSGVTATNANYDSARNGYSSGDTVATINTTASPGHLATIAIRDATAGFLDELSASSTVLENTLRASRQRNVPEDLTALRIQIRCINLASAPATTTTLTVGFIEIENFVSQQVSLVNVSPMSLNAALPVQVSNTPAVTVSSGTVTTVSTVTAVTTLTTLANGQTAHSVASTGSPVRVGGRVNTAVDTTLIAGDASDLFVTTAGQLVEKPYAAAELDWQASSGITALATATSTALKAAGAAGVRNYCTGAQFYNTSATVSTTVSILDGASVIWTGYLPATTAALPVVDLQVVFPTPLRGTAATALNVQLGTTLASVYYNAQGYQAP